MARYAEEVPLRTFTRLFGLLGSGRPHGPTYREPLASLFQGCAAANDTPNRNDVKWRGVPLLTSIFGPPDRRFPHTKVSFTTSAALAVGLIPAYAASQGAVLAVDRRAEFRIRSGTSDVHGDDIASTAFAHAQAILGQQCCDGPALQCSFQSPLPKAVGLKGSSALALTAVVGAAAAIGRDLDLPTVIRVALELQSRLALTQAGSCDDTWSAAVGGLVVADAATGKLIARLSPPSIRVVILVPRLSTAWAHRIDRVALLRPHAARVRKMLGRLLDGDIYGASTESALFHARELRYSVQPLLVALAAGALAVCQSGKGPAVAALASEKAESEIVRAWREGFPDASVFQTRPSDTGLAIHHDIRTKETCRCR